jgi:hypothetical protein
MATIRAAAAPDEDKPALAPRAARSGSSRARMYGLLLVLVLVPLVVALLALIGTHWHPSSDDAIEVLRIRDVGGRHTPLTGAPSRYGWDHPGPLLFWLLAPSRWVAGNTGVLVGVVCINGAALAAALLLARRRGGLPFAVLLGVAMLILVRALGANLLIDPWNPWVAVLPFLVYLLLAWSVAERDLAALPWLVAVGSFLVQTHVGYAPLVAGAGATAVVLALLRHPDEPGLVTRDVRKWAVLTAGVAALVWLGPLIQQFTGSPGNLGEIVDYFRDPAEKTIGFRYGFGLMGKELAFPGPWIRGDDNSALGFVFTASTITALVLLVATLALGSLAWRRGNSGAARLAFLMAATAGFGVLAGARITGPPGPYLLRWWWVIAALLWCSLLWSAWSLLGAARARAMTPALVATGCAAMAVLAAVVARDAVPARVPQQQYSRTIGKLANGTASRLVRDRRYLVTFVDTRDLGAVGVGTFLDLADRGFRVKVPRAFGHAFGSWRVARDGAVDGTIAVVSGDSLETFRPPPGAVQAVRYDPLSAADRRRAQELERDIRAHAGPDGSLQPSAVDSLFGRGTLVRAGVSAATIDALRELRRPGLAYEVWINPTPT